MRLGHVCVRGGGLVVHAWGSPQGLAAVRLGEVPDAGAPGVDVGSPDAALEELSRAMEAFLAGQPLVWEGTLDLRGVTEFQASVFSAVREIPFGHLCTYGQVARRLGRPEAVRAVGNALHRNPFPVVVPCHRVLREGGQIGGYSCGVWAKRRLLAIESGQTELPLERA